MTEEIITGLDIGSSKVAVVIASRSDNDSIEVLGVSKKACTGVKKGNIVNLEKTSEAIASAIEEAEIMAGVEVSTQDTIYVGLSGTHVMGQNSHGICTIPHPNREITQQDIDRVIESAQTRKMPAERGIIHVLPLEFIVDEQFGVKDPIGMTGVRLETNVHVITGSISAAQNIERAVNRAGFRVRDLVIESLAAGEAIVSEDEKEVGTLLIDIGAGTTNAMLYHNGAVHATSVIPLAGNNITGDIHYMLRVPEITAERLKLQYGCAISDHVNGAENIEIPTINGRPSKVIPRKELAIIIEPRVREIFDLVKESFKTTNLLDQISGGIVITGGTGLLDGILENAEQVFGMEARLGKPRNIDGLKEQVDSPIYSTAVGLTGYGLSMSDLDPFEPTRIQPEMEDSGSGFKDRIQSFIKEIFS